MYKKSIILFRKDLRLEDNIALYNATKLSEKVFPLFVFDERQVTSANKYKSNNALDFMISSLKELEQECKEHDGILSFKYGHVEEAIEKIFKKESIDALFLNKDYTPFALKRDAHIEKLCKKYKVEFHAYDDGVLNAPGTVLTGKKTPYTIFTPFCKKAITLPVSEPFKSKSYNFVKNSLESAHNLTTLLKKIEYTHNSKKYVYGGTHEAKKILKKLEQFKNYVKTRDFPELPTTYLGAHIKFGTVSIRQVYYAVKNESHSSVLLKQLYWRDFFIHLGYYFPHVFKTAFHKKYADIAWVFNKKYFDAWCQGKTGFPIVDAGMRQLNQTGYMHNRVRMIVGSFLTKNLHISWQEGERYFAQQLTDYDPAVNNGSWQWVASTGADAQPYFRVFNPWLQQKKFDPHCMYIKKWVPELQKCDVKKIHSYYKSTVPLVSDYPLPIVDYASTSKYVKKLFKK